MVGEPEYMAPEIVGSKGHSKEVDWWALGIVIHEMVVGYPPFFHQETYQIYTQILNKDKEVEMTVNTDQYCKDLCKKLLTRDPKKRIGASKNGAEDIKKHKWYRGLNWAALYNKTMEIPMALPNGDPLGSIKDGVATGDGVPKIMQARTLTGGPDVSNFSKERSPTSTDYPNSTDDQGPQIDQSKDEDLFSNWGSGKTVR